MKNLFRGTPPGPRVFRGTPPGPRAQHRLAAFGLVAGLLGGGAAGMALGLPGFAGAQTTDSSPSTTAPADPAAPAPKPERGAWLRGALAPLVEKGTITQSQADAVIAALEAAKPVKGPGRHGPGGKGFRGGPGRLDAAATAIGITVEELRTALQGGESLADVAKSKGVDAEKVVSALVAGLKAHLDQEVASGRHTQAEVDQKLARVTERIRAFVNGEVPLKARPGGFRHRHGFGARPDDAPAAPSSVTPPNASVIDA
ncbi:MAG: hypothetical protein M3357_07760 [Actinomycetota bacterium]|nr:hypothetical protein [Actinomycetota bacterium]